MSIVYVDNVKRKSRINLQNADANSYYLDHFHKSLVLKAVEKHAITKRDFTLSAQARHEIDINAKKLSYWYKHKNFELSSDLLQRMTRAKSYDYSKYVAQL